MEAVKTHALGERYIVLAPAALDPKRDQNSLVLVSKAKFGMDEFAELSGDVLASLTNAPVANGVVGMRAGRCQPGFLGSSPQALGAAVRCDFRCSEQAQSTFVLGAAHEFVDVSE